jgi:hypothetical protein
MSIASQIKRRIEVCWANLSETNTAVEIGPGMIAMGLVVSSLLRVKGK